MYFYPFFIYNSVVNACGSLCICKSLLINLFSVFSNLLWIDGIAKEELMIGQEETGGTGSYNICLFYFSTFYI